jgi:hypothetical protein
VYSAFASDCSEAFRFRPAKLILRRLTSKPTHHRSQIGGASPRQTTTCNCDKMADSTQDKTHSESQVYLSTRGGDYDVCLLFSPSGDARGHLLTLCSSLSRPLSSRDSPLTEVSSCRIRFPQLRTGYVCSIRIYLVAWMASAVLLHLHGPMAKTGCSATGKTSPTRSWPLRSSASTFRDPRSPPTT